MQKIIYALFILSYLIPVIAHSQIKIKSNDIVNKDTIISYSQSDVLNDSANNFTYPGNDTTWNFKRLNNVDSTLLAFHFKNFQDFPNANLAVKVKKEDQENIYRKDNNGFYLVASGFNPNQISDLKKYISQIDNQLDFPSHFRLKTPLPLLKFPSDTGQSFNLTSQTDTIYLEVKDTLNIDSDICNEVYIDSLRISSTITVKSEMIGYGRLNLPLQNYGNVLLQNLEIENEYDLRLKGICFNSFGKTKFGWDSPFFNNILEPDQLNIYRFWAKDKGYYLMEVRENQNNNIEQINYLSESAPAMGLFNNYKSRVNVTLYPNPVEQEINLRIEDQTLNHYKVSLYNTLGNKISESWHKKNNKKIMLDDLPDGMYFIKITNKAGELIHEGSFIKK